MGDMGWNCLEVQNLIHPQRRESYCTLVPGGHDSAIRVAVADGKPKPESASLINELPGGRVSCIVGGPCEVDAEFEVDPCMEQSTKGVG